jgi:hypothetical protein
MRKKSKEKIKFRNFYLRVADLIEIRRMKVDVGHPIDLADIALIDEFLELTRKNDRKKTQP